MIGLECVWGCKGCGNQQTTRHLFHTAISRSLLQEPYCSCTMRELIITPDKCTLLRAQPVEMTPETDPKEFTRRYVQVINKYSANMEDAGLLFEIVNIIKEQFNGNCDNKEALRAAIYKKFLIGRSTTDRYINKLIKLGILREERWGERNIHKRILLVAEDMV